jgi:hypothetical protein
MDRIEEIIIDLRVDNVRMEEKLLNLERYIVKDLKDSLDINSKKIEARFKWMIGLFIAFMGIAIGVPLAI